MKWLKRIDVLTEPYAGEFQTGHYMYEWPDRPHEPVSLMRVRARITEPAAGIDHQPRAHTPCAARPGREPGPSRGSTSASPAKATGTRRGSSRPGARTTGRTGRSTGTADDVGRHTLRARATDAAGHAQPEVPPWNRLGYGNNAVEVIYIDVG